MIHIKFCGITREQDARNAVQIGANAIGLILSPGFKRSISIAKAKSIAQVIPPFVSVVGVFVDPTIGFVRKVLDQVPLTLLQFHGNESPEFCAQFKRPYIKAIVVKPKLSLQRVTAHYASAQALLLDSPGGGSGKAFNWSSISHGIKKPIILAGGLTSQNVAQAIAQVKPNAVDVASGIESAVGIKSIIKMEAFYQAVRGIR